MANYVYIKSEPHLWTVGSYDPDGKWHSDSDHGDREKAANRVRFLNGGFVTVGDEDLKDKKAKAGEVIVKMDFQDDDVTFHEEAEIEIPKAYQATGRQAVTFSILEMMGLMPEDMNAETAKSIGLTEIDLPKSPDITIIVDGDAMKIDLLQFMGIAKVVSEMLDALEVDDSIVDSIRRYSGRN